MRQRQPAQLDIRSILQAAFDARDEVPDLWALWLAQGHGTDDGWHERPASWEPWRHHASAISECVRRSVFDRDLREREPLSVESNITFDVGHHIHTIIQFGIAVHPDYMLLSHECGGDLYVPDLGVTISAHADIVYEHEGIVCLLEIKTEKAWASTGRRKEAKAAGRSSAVKRSHAEQVKVQQIVLQGLELFDVVAAWVVYFEKNDGQLDQQPVDLDDPDLMAAVGALLDARENAWARWHVGGRLPERLATFPDKGLCKPRSETDARGMYCPYRIECTLARPD